MEKILHQFGCPKNFFGGDKKTFSGIRIGAGFFPSTIIVFNSSQELEGFSPPNKNYFDTKELRGFLPKHGYSLQKKTNPVLKGCARAKTCYKKLFHSLCKFGIAKVLGSF